MNDNDICMNSCTIDAFHCHPVAVAVVAMLLISLPSHMGALFSHLLLSHVGEGITEGETYESLWPRAAKELGPRLSTVEFHSTSCTV